GRPGTCAPRAAGRCARSSGAPAAPGGRRGRSSAGTAARGCSRPSCTGRRGCCWRRGGAASARRAPVRGRAPGRGGRRARRAPPLVEEVRFCERSLLQRGYADRLDDELIPALPAGSPDAVGRVPPAGGLDLEELLEHSTLHTTRVLAALALLRSGRT